MIHYHTTTNNSANDESLLEPLLEQIEERQTPVADVCLDGTYDNFGNYESLFGHNITPVVPPRKGAVAWYVKRPGDMGQHPRNVAIKRIDEVGRRAWKQEALYHWRSLSETAMFRFKSIFGVVQYSHRLANQI